MTLLTAMERPLEAALQQIKTYIITGNGKNVPVRLRRQAKSYTVVGEWLLRRTTDGLCVIPPVKERRRIVNACHDAVGHWGASATLERVRSRFWWPRIVKEVSDYVKSCHECQLCDNRKNTFCGNKQPVEKLFSTFSMDFAGPLPQSQHGNQYLLLAVEHLSRWVILKPTKSQTSTEAIKFFEDEIVRQFGSPGAIVTDGGPAFVSTAWRSALRSEGTNAKIVAPYSPQANGRAERMVRTVKAALTKVVLSEGGEWDAKIRAIERFYRTRSASDGFSPFDMMYGEQHGRQKLWPRIFLAGNGSTVLEGENAGEAAQRNARIVELVGMCALRAERYIPRTAFGDNGFSVGDLVKIQKPRLNRMKPLSASWMGPCKVIRCRGARCWLRDANGKASKTGVHVRRLKIYHPRN